MENIVSNEYLEKLTIEEAKFIFEHAEKQLQDSLDTNQLIITRTSTLITVTLALLLGLIGYAINKYQTIGHFDNLITSALFGSLYLFILSIWLTNNIRPKQYSITGSEPKLFFVENFFKEPNPENRLLYYYVNEIESYQIRIETNKITNATRWTTFNNCLWMLICTPIVLGFVFLILNLFFH